MMAKETFLKPVFVVSIAVASLFVASANADLDHTSVDRQTNQGPSQGFSTVFGSKLIVAYFEQRNGSCTLTLMLTENTGPDHQQYFSAARLRFSVDPGKSMRIDSAEGQSLNVICNESAETVTVQELANVS